MYNKLEGKIEPTFSDLESGALMRPPSWKYAPPWANYVAQDEDGRWHWFEDKPFSSAVMQQWVHFESEESFEIQRKEPVFPTHVPDWMETLSPRPSLEEASK